MAFRARSFRAQWQGCMSTSITCCPARLSGCRHQHLRVFCQRRRRPRRGRRAATESWRQSRGRHPASARARLASTRKSRTPRRRRSACLSPTLRGRRLPSCSPRRFGGRDSSSAPANNSPRPRTAVAEADREVPTARSAQAAERFMERTSATSATHCPPPPRQSGRQGVLHVRIGANGLKAADRNGLSDPYQAHDQREDGALQDDAQDADPSTRRRSASTARWARSPSRSTSP